MENTFDVKSGMAKINSQIDEVWTDESLSQMFNELSSEFSHAGIPMTPEIQTALLRSADRIAKTTTKNTLVATVNLLAEFGLVNIQD